MIEQAIEKLEKEYQDGKYDRYAEIMKGGTLEALKQFCRQAEEFAQAVVQGGTFEDCMKVVAKNCGHGISDITAYERAVQFYFPTATIRCTMAIGLAPHVHDGETDSTGRRAVVLNLADFL